jgi:hypothetical protein
MSLSPSPTPATSRSVHPIASGFDFTVTNGVSIDKAIPANCYPR